MAWADIPDFVDGVPVASTDIAALAYNLEYIRRPASQVNTITSNLVFPITQPNWTFMGSNYEATIETTGGMVMVWLSGTMRHTGNIPGQYFHLDIEVDGVLMGNPSWGLFINSSVADGHQFTYPILGLSAGTHVFKLYYKISGGATVMTLYATHVFGVREM